MNNSKLTVTVRNKVPEIVYGDYLVSDNKQIRIVFDLDSEWNACVRKTARFILDGWQFDVAFTGDTVTLPLLPAYTGELKVGLFAGDLKTTTAVSIPVRDSVLASSGDISLQDAAEMARVAAEAARADAEDARADAELQRQQAEYARQFSENLRADAESARANAERGRSANESARQSAESARAAAELARNGAESARIAAENARVNAENGRELAEYRRNLAEQSRQSAEDARSAAEAARARAESARSTAETLRAAAEQARASAESERTISENRRISAESARVSAEEAREAQESARVSAELSRQRNEAQRVQNELDRVAAELLRERHVDEIIDDFSDYMQHNDVFDVLALIREYGMKDALRLFCCANAPLVGLDAAAARFFAAAGATVSETYTSTFYLYNTSPSPVGSKKDANANLVCEPSTNETAGRDDYAELPLFACFDCNYTIDGTTLEPVIHAIKDVYGDFSPAPSVSLVGVLQMTGWVRRTADSTSKTVEYAAFRKNSGFKPLPEAVRASDNSVRPFVIHAKYPAGYNSRGRLSSISGVQPVTGRPAEYGGASTSRSGQIPLWREWGSQYAGSGICDQAFLQTMFELKYANLGSENVMKGCVNLDLRHKAAISETGVRRIVMEQEQGDAYPLGASISITNEADGYTVSNGIVRITRKETVEIGGVEYTALYVDSNAAFDTTAGTTFAYVHPWRTGSTDSVKGNDGSPVNNLSGREPFKLQGIEVMSGMYEALSDVVIEAETGLNRVFVNRLAANISENKGTDPALIGTSPRGGSSGWHRIAELSWETNDPEGYMLMQQFHSNGYNTGYCSSQNLRAGNVSSGLSAWLSCGALNTAEKSGLACAHKARATDYTDYTIGCRACGTGANRGVYTESTETIG